uniref:Calcium-dependent protein kinase 1 n=1 Tax=Chromera velia CCMP2878 TaxID=1169474 RepID=A0A0G4IFX6_9ALVE|mmetsp:Transcript_46151/g.90961  ORF Transcript_46151/g.90961 Transcript_46151/m.90961 type:complete len:479 (-) Transcript_46151:72-1508(-)|eukprot:Cvel_14111.t1-p1 / transcript=Cvel_14111.t1 / gene=Cvel_14111 / organism=Chromera_velia_CCMP2878 / gene_product=Calcium-dependent protein kinase 2, putative / transcript_product=Calcium-dependent protein kinase 2, putative / location=Cvel_scaffold993:41444-47159(+) / protein_length=478 / sequence_SO=supercontig / SO=protein_coding / is_pseudo=false
MSTAQDLREGRSPSVFKREGFIISSTGDIDKFYDRESKSIGTGSYGSVCKATNKSTGAVRAIKKISKREVKNIDRFKQEIAFMKQLDHPNIVKLFETFEDSKTIYLVLELCTGGELFDRIIGEGYFTEKMAATLMRQILAAVYYCHCHNIVHRDLKPENFLFLNKEKNSPLKIIDFGLAAYWQPGQILKTKAGTPYYVAPQVLRGEYGRECDLWSAGVIMYILLCGYPPFHGDSDKEILTKVKKGKYSFNEADWKDISGDAKDLIQKLLTYEPKERTTAEQALNHPWIKSNAASASDVPVNKGILDNFRTFRAQSRLKKAALTVIAQQMSETDIKQLKSIFLSLDKNGDGSLTVQEIRDGMAKAGMKDIPRDLDILMKEVDSDGSGVIDYTEFIAASLDRRQYIQEDVCWAAFRVFDLDGNGRITADELQQVLGMDDVNAVFGGKNLSEIKSMIQEVDKNGDGEIDFDEFMTMMKSKV